MTAALPRMSAGLTVPFARGADLLELTLLPSGQVASYDFAEHHAQFGVEPRPAYTLMAVSPIDAATVVTVGFDLPGGGNGELTVRVPPGTAAGTSFGFEAPPGAILRTVTPGPWRLTALLGMMARLLWTIAAERDVLDGQADVLRTRARIIGEATGATLDLIGYDLGVPRFPPLPYAQQDDTIALYHLDDERATPIRDAWVLYSGGPGHPGVATADVEARVPGRFGTGMRFSPGAEITVAHHAELATGATASLTAECFVKPGDGTILSKQDPSDATRPGWQLGVGDFGRGLPRNVRLLISDGTDVIELYANRSLSAARFTHLAAVVDRAAGAVRLVVDGTIADRKPLAGLGSLANTQPVRIGRSFTGTIDEVRLSAAARDTFFPVLGEADDSYRKRLGIFRRWVLPTPAGLRDAVNDVAGPIAGVATPFVVDDVNASLVQATRVVSVLPLEVPAGGTMDDTGRIRLTEAEVLGTPADDASFSDRILVDGTDPRAGFQGSPLMRPGTRAALRAMLDVLPAGLTVRSGFDPAAADLRATGRALILSHDVFSPGRLAGFALRAGFGFVAPRSTDLYASARSTDSVEIIAGPGGTATPQNGFDVLTGQTLALRLEPAPPPGAAVSWSVIPCGGGRAGVSSRRDQRDVLLTADRPGPLVVTVQVRDRGKAFIADRRLRIGVATLDAGQSLGTPPAATLRPEDRTHPVYLVPAPVRFRATGGPESRRVHPAVADRLTTLVPLLPPGDPELTSAWDPASDGPAGSGYVITLRLGGSTTTLARLGALAYAAGFDFVASDGTTLTLACGLSPDVVIDGPETTAVGSSVELGIRSSPLSSLTVAALAVAAGLVWTVNTETETVSALDPAGGEVKACVKTGLSPIAIAAAPDESLLLVADTGDTTVTVITTADRRVAGRIQVTGAPIAVTFRPDGARAYVAMLPGRIAEIDPVTRTVTAFIDLGVAPTAMACEPGGARLWITTGNGRLRSVALPQFQLTGADLNLAGGVPAGLAVSDTLGYVTLPEVPCLRVVNLGVAPSLRAAFTDVGSTPTSVTLDPAGDLVYVGDLGGGGRLHRRHADGTPHTPPSVAQPDPAAIATGGGHVYVAGRMTVSVLDAADASLEATWPLGLGLGERFIWTVRVTGGAQAQLSSTTGSRITLTGGKAGPVQVRVVLQQPGGTPPYTVRVGFAQALLDLEAAGGEVVVRKDQYDLVMNVLNHLCPVGVEIDTRAVREHVLELRDALLEAFPPYTYPDFRARGPRPPGWTFGLDP
ncbi:hypothetical protein KOI35_42640 [Actinoplanes bogorensis]|uniref:LamG-like jellyroll fold domain-containing protein n=1 Tax=Paractinoplanes bogorensis TaxID=1610840 RepID=A0ABS5Z3F2_9ACTN|nr:LamG-like jellyroll fold domain-containing protein [Actinoplanes bogorensis]MBU2670220.1 hypothetical protein [Actinoplanes bogorensis]